MDVSLRLRLDAPSGPDGAPVLVAGERIPVEVTCSGRELPPSLAWRLAWRTEGKGGTNAGVGAEGTLQPSGGTTRFTLDVPPGPWSYAGGLLKIRWELEVWAAGANGVETATDVTLLPRDRMPGERAEP